MEDTLAAVEDIDEEALDTEETDCETLEAEALLEAEDPLEVVVVTAPVAEVEGAVEAVEAAVEVQETAVGRPVTPAALQKFKA